MSWRSLLTSQYSRQPLGIKVQSCGKSWLESRSHTLQGQRSMPVACAGHVQRRRAQWDAGTCPPFAFPLYLRACKRVPWPSWRPMGIDFGFGAHRPVVAGRHPRTLSRLFQTGLQHPHPVEQQTQQAFKATQRVACPPLGDKEEASRGGTHSLHAQPWPPGDAQNGFPLLTSETLRTRDHGVTTISGHTEKSSRLFFSWKSKIQKK